MDSIGLIEMLYIYSQHKVFKRLEVMLQTNLRFKLNQVQDLSGNCLRPKWDLMDKNWLKLIQQHMQADQLGLYVQKSLML